MKLNLTIEDRLYEVYETNPGFPKAYKKMKDALEAFSNIPDNDRVLLVHGQPRKDLETLFGTTLDSGEKLVQLVKKMNQVQIEGVELNFDAEELHRLRMQATFHGRSVEQYIKEMIIEIKDRMLERV